MEVLLDVNRAIGRHLGRDELFGALAACLRNVFETDRFGIEPPSGSAREADTVQKVFKARVRAQRIEARPQQDARVKSLFVASFEPTHGLIRLPESYIDHGNLRSMRITRVRALLQIVQ